MAMERTLIDIRQMARQMLLLRKAQGLKTVLVLGSRAGGLARSSVFSQTMHAFIDTSAQAIFSQYYHLFNRSDTPFGAMELQALLRASLAHVSPDEADRCLATLIMQGYFDPIITTNADTLLEQALSDAGWHDAHDFQVVNLVAEPEIQQIPTGSRSTVTLIKVFGELRVRNYLLTGRYSYINVHQNLTHILRGILRQNCLFVGIDDTWDAALLQALPAQGESCWIVMDQEPDRHSPFYAIKETRTTRFFLDTTYGRYAPFIQALYRELLELSSSAISSNRATTVDPPEAPVKPEEQESREPLHVFISYHPKDEIYLDKLVNHLTTLQRERLIASWLQRNIIGGQPYADEIQRQLQRASLILLLVSDDFIASEELYRREVQQAMLHYQQGSAIVIPLLLRPVDWQGTIFGDLKPLPTDHRFVTEWSDIDSAFLDIVKAIRKMVT